MKQLIILTCMDDNCKKTINLAFGHSSKQLQLFKSYLHDHHKHQKRKWMHPDQDVQHASKRKENEET